MALHNDLLEDGVVRILNGRQLADFFAVISLNKKNHSYIHNRIFAIVYNYVKLCIERIFLKILKFG